jgi:CubicO group peptidase (beta-lactamase class C family)
MTDAASDLPTHPDLIELLDSSAALASVLPPAVIGGPRRRPGGLVALSAHGQHAVLPIGFADLDNGVAITESTVFDCGSLAKPFTAACVLLLCAQGLLDLDQPVRHQLPELGEAYGLVSIRHLLSHFSGIRDYGPMLAVAGARRNDFITQADVLGLLARQQSLGFAPGTCYEYSNSNYVLLAILAERLTGQSLSALCADLLWRPAGMSSTSFRDDLAKMVPGRAKSYEPEGAGYRHAYTPSTVVGDGGLLSTGEDLLRWGEWLAASAGARIPDEMFAPAVMPDGRTMSYGLGLFVGGHDEDAWFGHGGSYEGFQSEWRVLPARGIVAVAMSNWSLAVPARLVESLLEAVISIGRLSCATDAGAVWGARSGWSAETHSYVDQCGDGWQLCPAPPGCMCLLGAQLQVLLTARPDGSLVGDHEGVSVVCRIAPNGEVAVRFGVRDLVLQPWNGELATESLADYAGRFWCADLLTEAVVSVAGPRLRWRRRAATETLLPVVTDIFRAGATWLRFERTQGQVSAIKVDAPRARNLRFVVRDTPDQETPA